MIILVLRLRTIRGRLSDLRANIRAVNISTAGISRVTVSGVILRLPAVQLRNTLHFRNGSLFPRLFLRTSGHKKKGRRNNDDFRKHILPHLLAYKKQKIYLTHSTYPSE